MLGIHRVFVHDRPFDAVYMDLAGLKLVNTCQALDQRRLPGAVFPHQRTDLTLFQCEVHIVQRFDSGEGHADPPHR